ncbi:MAG: hypothetical protein U0270_29635 [Labilithrix sp.]
MEPATKVAVLLAALVAASAGACVTASTTTSSAPRRHEPRPPLAGATAEPGIAYASSSRMQTLDLYRPKKGQAPYPLVIRIDGEPQSTSAAAIVDAGYALAIVRYRPPAEATLVAAARDVKAAVRFLRASAARYELDADRFIAWGSADAGWFAVMLGVTSDQATVFDDASLGHPTTSSAVQVVIDWGGPTDFASLDVDQASHSSPACSQTYQRHTLAGTNESQWVCGDRSTALTDPACASAAHDVALEGYVARLKRPPAFYFAHGADDCVTSIWQTVRVLEALKKREEAPGFHRMSRAGRDDARFEAEETGRSLAFIHETFHPEAGARRD